MSTELYTDIETNSTLSTGIWKSAAAAAPWERISWGMALGFLLVSYVVYEQLTFMWKRKHLPGPMFVFPFLGGVIPMIVNPTQFWDDQAVAAKKVGLCSHFLLGKFVLFVRDSEISHKIFANVRPGAFQLVGHPLGSKLFGKDNLIFMFGQDHKDLRGRLAPLFTLKALGIYISIQEKTARKHIATWLASAEKSNDPVQLRLLIRDMNLETSQNAFVGPYLTPELRQQFNYDYNLFNQGLMSLPVSLPGFAFHAAKKAVPRLIATLASCAKASKVRMMAEEEPACLIDFWIVEVLKQIREAEEAGAPMPRHTSDSEIGYHVFDFLFAAQDASTSSITWAATLLESHPDMLEKVRQEQKFLQHDSPTGLTPELLRKMKYTEMVVKEVLRYRPPATLVPHIAADDFPLTDTYTVPKGTIVFPSLLESSFQGFTNPYEFDPDRFSAERLEDQVYKRNWLLFGAGPHQCIGQRYAMNQLLVFTALYSTLVDAKRVRTPDCDDIKYTPTIAPKDGGLVYLSPYADSNA